MRSVKLVLVAGLSAVILLPAVATAEQWIVNCESLSVNKPLCLDVTDTSAIQVSTCDKNKQAQRWDADSIPTVLKNLWKNEVLDLNVPPGTTVGGSVMVSPYNPNYKAQTWNSASGSLSGGKGGLLQNKYTNQCLTAATADLSPVTLVPNPCNPANQQQVWRFANIGDSTNQCK